MLPKERAYLAIDMPGHGKSSHYPKGMIYHLVEDGITLIRRIVKHYKWSNVTLMGHSLGGVLSFMYASIYDNPNDVSKIIMIDTAGLVVFDQEKLASDAAHCIDKMLKFDNYPISMQPCHNYETMVGVVLDGHKGSITKKGAKALMIRGTMAAPENLNKPDGLIFTRDLRLKVSSFGTLTEEQALMCAKRIRCEVLNIRAKPFRRVGDPTIYAKIIDTLRENCKRLVYEEVEDVTHHLHLEAPSRICKFIQEFLLANPIDETQDDDICVF